MVKEADEEASIPKFIAETGQLISHVQYCYHNEYFVKREYNFVFDLQLPPDFTPNTNDGETVDFRQVKLGGDCEKIFQNYEEWKPNCFAISLDFAMRKKSYDTDLNISEIENLILNNEMFEFS